MSSLILLLLVPLLCFPMHACNARDLCINDDKPDKHLHLHQDPQKGQLHHDNSKFSRKRVTQDNLNEFHEAWVGENTINGGLRHLRGVENSHKGFSGKQSILSSSEDGMQLAPKLEEQKRQIRKMLASAQDDTQEQVGSQENDPEDVVVMDYAQPHRKPPIHNEKP